MKGKPAVSRTMYQNTEMSCSIDISPSLQIRSKTPSPISVLALGSKTIWLCPINGYFKVETCVTSIRGHSPLIGHIFHPCDYFLVSKRPINANKFSLILQPSPNFLKSMLPLQDLRLKSNTADLISIKFSALRS